MVRGRPLGALFPTVNVEAVLTYFSQFGRVNWYQRLEHFDYYDDIIIEYEEAQAVWDAVEQEAEFSVIRSRTPTELQERYRRVAFVKNIQYLDSGSLRRRHYS